MRSIYIPVLSTTLLVLGCVDGDVSEGDLAAAEQAVRVSNFCITEAGYELVSGDFDGDLIDDLMCHGRSNAAWPGKTAILYGQANGRFSSLSSWESNANWCGHRGGVRYFGDFNGDRRTDMLCHDARTGEKWISFANRFGNFVHGTSYYLANGWCAGPNRMVVGDFNGDDRDDLACQDPDTGYLWLDYADKATGKFATTDWERAAFWCTRMSDDDEYSYHTEDLVAGDFDGDGLDDLMCKDYASPYNAHVDFADPGGYFYGTDFVMAACAHPDFRAYIGDANRDHADDLFCHSRYGTFAQYLSQGSARRFGSQWMRSAGWCVGAGERLVRGDFNGDERDDLLCNSGTNGKIWIDYADDSGFFMGSDYSTF